MITGNPGVGKHTIARELSKRTKFQIFDLNEVAKENNLLERTDNTNDVDVQKLESIITSLSINKSIIVGHLAPYCIPKNMVRIAFVLRRNPYDLYEIYRSRNYDLKKIRENQGAEILGVIAFDSLEKFDNVIQIDCSSKQVPEIVEIILNVLDGKNYNDFVDWLEMTAVKKDFKTFFPSE